ncbi:MAG: AAA family ATPase [Hyphomonas sp.]
MTNRSKPPASGEISAISGYLKQYEYSAVRIYRGLQSGGLEAVVFADPSAGIFDDHLLEIDGKVESAQIKSSTNAQYVRLNSALVESASAKEIADSWRNLRDAYPNKDITATYVFAGLFNKQDIDLGNKGALGARHSAAFARFVSSSNISEKEIEKSVWSEALERFRTNTQLEETQFPNLLQSLTLEDLTGLLKDRIENFQSEDGKRIEELRNLIPILIANADNKRRWTACELMDKLGWTQRPSQRHIHEFPVPDNFQENSDTLTELAASLSSTTQGYIALVGPPGTGKSTLLQRSLYSTDAYSITRYLAFHPDQRHGLGRAEATEFLNDTIAALRSHGLKASRFYNDSLTSLRETLSRQLEEATKRYTETGRKTVLIIDGLDHVEREENPIASFLRELPAASAIPEGVVVVLGTQRLDLNDLHPTIAQQCARPNRTVEVQPLSRASIYALAAVAGVQDSVNLTELYKASSGHPLTVTYLVNALVAAVTDEERSRILSLENGIGRSAEEIYERVWNAIKTADDTKDALGVLARAEGSISPEQLAAVTSDAAVEELLLKAGFLLQCRKDSRLSIFHNSFRLSIANQTSIKFGKPSDEKEKRFHSRLAEISQNADDSDPQYWLELRYRARANDDEAVLRIGTPTYFREMLKAFRPPSEVFNDLRLTYGATLSGRSRVTLLNKLLISKEINYRLEAVDNIDFVELFLDLGDAELAIKHALEGEAFADGWLTLVDELYEDGQVELARQIFEANEPLEAIFSGDGFDRAFEKKTAAAWARRAHRFRSVEEVAQIISTMPLQSSPLEEQNEDDNRSWLRYELALGVVLDNPSTDIRQLCQDLALTKNAKARLNIEATLAWPSDDQDGMLAKLEEASKSSALNALHSSWRRALAIKAEQNGQKAIARSLTETLLVPHLGEDRMSYERNALQGTCRSIYETMLLALKLGLPVKEVVPDQSTEKSELVDHTQRHILELASLRHEVETNTGQAITQHLFKLLKFFSRARPVPGDFQSHKFYGALSWLPFPIVRIASFLSPEDQEAVFAFVDSELADPASNLASSLSFRLNFAKSAFAINADLNAAKERIQCARTIPGSEHTPQEAVESIIEVAKAYREVNCLDEAYSCLDDLHTETFGYWLRAKKEPQYEFWIWAYRQVCKENPELAGKASLSFCQFLLGMDETEGSETAIRVVGDLIKGAGAAPSSAAGVIARLLDSNLTTWNRLSDATLASIVETDPAMAPLVLICFNHVVVPFLGAASWDSAVAALHHAQNSKVNELAEGLIYSAERYCPPSQREGLYEAIIGRVPSTESVLKDVIDTARSISRTLTVAMHGDRERQDDGGVSLDIDAATISELIDAGDGTDDYGNGVNYSYATAAVRLIPKSALSEIDALLSARPHLEREARVMIACSRRMSELGIEDRARVFFEKAEEAAYTGHWSRFLGGQKLELQQRRVELDGDKGRDVGFNVLVKELSAGQTSGNNLFLNLDDVLESISVEKRSAEIWAELEDHIKQYREFRLACPVEADPEVKTSADLLAYVLALAFSFSVPELGNRARNAAKEIGEHALGHYVLPKFFKFLRSLPNGDREAAAICFNLKDSSPFKTQLIEEARSLERNDDFVVRNLAQRSLRQFGEQPIDQTKDLPAFYQIVTPETRQAEEFAPPPGLGMGSRPMWSDDPWTWTSMMKFVFNITADHSDVTLSQLRRRCADLMRQEGGREAFGPEVEQAIERKQRRLDLKYSYRRPLSQSACRNMGRVIQELADAEAIDPRIFRYIWDEIGGPALSSFRFNPTAMPKWIMFPNAPHRQTGGSNNDRWIEDADQSAFIPLLNDRFIIAEQAPFKVNVWRDELKCARVVLPMPLDVSGGLEKLNRVAAVDDLQPLYKQEDSQLLCRIPSNMFGDLEDDALTICPYVAHRMGWHRESHNPLKLFDDQGNPVCETVPWVFGTNTPTTYEAELFGEGQGVFLSNVARAQIEDEYGPLRLSIEVSRSAKSDGKLRGERVVGY